MKDAVKTENKKKLGVAELSCYGIGNCIGSGIFVSMGTAIGFTGRSIPLALVVACILVLFAYAYKTLMSGMFVLPGGNYSQSALLQPPILVGVSAISSIFVGLAFAMYGLSIVEYASVIFPQIAPYGKFIAIGIITLFFVTTFMGGKFMAKFNLVMVGILIVSLLIYIIAGIPKVDFSTVNPLSEGYFSDGPFGFIMAVAMMSFACQGATRPIEMTADAKDPKKTLPKAILIASFVVMIVYVLIAIVTAGVLPIEQVADKNLGVVAQQIFPHAIYVIFTLGGACFAIATSLYGAIAGIQHPMLATIDDGWLPAFLGKKTKKGYPWVMMLVLYIVAIVPIFVDMGLSELISLMMIPTMVLNLINNCLMFKLLKKYPDAWKNSFFHMPKFAFIITIILAIIADLIISVALFTTLKSGDQYFIIGMVGFLFAFSFYRIKAGKIDLKALEQAKAQAQKAVEESLNVN
jgi:APA family basic amino acid/polyamine antiporter